MHGYSSDSSDGEYGFRKNKGKASTIGTAAEINKKKPKRQTPPQEKINHVWKGFSNRKFGRVLSVLPFEPVLLPTVTEQSSELLTFGYERAAEECRRKVRKIIQECRRVNMRYRDAGFDLDWDLKMQRGRTLNHLGKTRYDLSSSVLSNPKSKIPKAVKRVHEIFDKATFMERIDAADIQQGSLGNCWIIASFSGLANVPGAIERLCVEYDTRVGIYGFVFYRDGEWIYSIIDDKLFLKSPCWDSPSMQRDLLAQIDREDVERVYRQTYQTGSKALFFAKCKDQNETWVPLMEKAYAKAHGDFASLSGGWIGEGLEDMSGGVTTELLGSDILDLDGFWEKEVSRVNDEFLFGCSTGLLDGGYGNREGIAEGHAYIIMDARTLKNGTRLVKLRNPWGKIKMGTWEGAWSDGSKEWTGDIQRELNHQFGSDSSFWISYEDMLRKYQHFDRTRLFREPNWRCTQRWIGVDVPWKPQYHEKFHFQLTCEGPLVLVLSQLDDRYFMGLLGQYDFRLHFRLHEQDRTGAEDYIVRSHGNYLMFRSVAVELPSILPGHYSVFVSVTARRHRDRSSIEDVVKRETEARVENEKLAQVGAAYDLAHSKAATHIAAVQALRKRQQQKEASDFRREARHREWEKRRRNREVLRAQAGKNKDKVEAKKEARRGEQASKAAEEAVSKEQCTQAQAQAQAQPEADCARPEVTRSTSAHSDFDVRSLQSIDSIPMQTPSPSGQDHGPSRQEKMEEKPSVHLIDPATVSCACSVPIEPPKGKPPTATADARGRKRDEAASDGESSASPVDDWEALYSSDDCTRNPTGAGLVRPSKYREETEEDNETEPWNAICIVGLRVYSKDEALTLRVVMEGDDLSADGGGSGMGKPGEADLDDAQANAGGARRHTKDGLLPCGNGHVSSSDTEDGAYEGGNEMEKRTRGRGRRAV